MMDKSTITGKEQVFYSVWEGLPAVVLFRALLFRCLPGWTLSRTNALFFGLLVLGVLVGNGILFRWQRTPWTATVSVLIPLGIFGAVCYAQVFPLLIRFSLLTALGLSAAYTCFLLCQKIPRKKRHYRRKILCNRLYRCLWVSLSLLAVSLSVVMAVLLANCLFNFSVLSASVKPISGTGEMDQRPDVEALPLLQEEQWQTLSARERLNVLQKVANTEAVYFGLPHELNVTAGNLEEDTCGTYRDDTHTICISLDYLMEESPREVLRTLYHESYHAFEHRMVDHYNALSPEEQKLLLYQQVAVYAREFQNYQDGTESFEGYYRQTCERDSRTYADSAVAVFYHVMGEDQQEPEEEAQEELELSPEQQQKLEDIQEQLSALIVEGQPA